MADIVSSHPKARRNRRGFVAVVALAALLLTAFAAPAAYGAGDVVRIGTLKLIGAAPLYVALEHGYFEEEGLDVRLEYFAAAAPIAVAVASGDVEVGATGITAALFNSIAGGSSMYLVADRGSEQPGYHLNSLVTTREKYDAGLQTVESLKGSRIGITSLGSTYHYQIGRILELHGLSLDDVELVPLRNISVMLEAVREGTVDAALVSPPWGAHAEEEGWGKIMFWAGDLMPYQVTGVFYSGKMRNNRDVAVRFMRAYIRGVRDYMDAAFGDDPEAKAKLVDIVHRHTDAAPDAIAQSLSYIDRDARPDVEDLMAQQDWYFRHGMISRVLQPEEFVDLSFIEEALQGL